MNGNIKPQTYKELREAVEQLLLCDAAKNIESAHIPDYFMEEIESGKAGMYVRFSQIDENTDNLLRKIVEIEENAKFYFMEIYPHEDDPQNSILIWSRERGFLL